MLIESFLGISRKEEGDRIEFLITLFLECIMDKMLFRRIRFNKVRNNGFDNSIHFATIANGNIVDIQFESIATAIDIEITFRWCFC